MATEEELADFDRQMMPLAVAMIILASTLGLLIVAYQVGLAFGWGAGASTVAVAALLAHRIRDWTDWYFLRQC